GGQVLRQRESRPPVLRVLRDQPLAELREPPRGAQGRVGALEACECEVRAVRRLARERFPCLHGGGDVSLALAHVAEVEVGRRRSWIDVDRLDEGTSRGVSLAVARAGVADLVGQEGENLPVLGAPGAAELRNLAA